MSTILQGRDYLALPRAAETFLVEPLLPQGGALSIYGDPKVGKSYAAIQLALAIQDGTPFLGFPVRHRGPVVYIQLDTPRSLWGERLDQLRATGLDVDSLLLADRETLGTWPFDILNPDHAQMLKTSLAPIEPVAVIIDTLREAHSADENDATPMRNVMAELVAATQPAALITVSHSRKASYEQGADLINDQRGSNYVVSRMDAIIRFSKKSMVFTGRAIEEGSIKLVRQDTGMWEPEVNEVDLFIAELMREDISTKEMARRLSEKIGRREEACRSLIRRWRAGQAEGVVE